MMVVRGHSFVWDLTVSLSNSTGMAADASVHVVTIEGGGVDLVEKFQNLMGNYILSCLGD